MLLFLVAFDSHQWGFMRLVSDSSPLIYIAKAGLLNLLCSEEPIGLVPAVFNEAILQGELHGHYDAFRLRRAVESGILIVVELTEEEREFASTLLASSRLGRGECETIACAERRKLIALLSDRKARRLAAYRGIPTLQLPHFLLLLLIQGHIGLESFTEATMRLAPFIGMDIATMREWLMLAQAIYQCLKR
jgi:predicted nucleic acid-binding protein